MDRQIAKASMQIRGKGFGRVIAKGEAVDLDAMVGGLPLRAHVDLANFEPPAAETTGDEPRRPRRRRPAATTEE